MIYFFLTLVGVIASHLLWAKLWPPREYWPQQEEGDMDTKTRVSCSGPYMPCGNSHKVGKVDTKTLVVGQKVSLFGCGFFEGTVVSVTPDGVGVESVNGFALFDKNGEETEDSRYRRVGGTATMPPEWGPLELRSLDEVNLARNVTSWLLEFLKSGEKPADEVFKEAEKKFGNAGDQVQSAFDTLGLTKRQENHRWYWCLRWELDEQNKVVGPFRR